MAFKRPPETDAAIVSSAFGSSPGPSIPTILPIEPLLILAAIGYFLLRRRRRKRRFHAQPDWPRWRTEPSMIRFARAVDVSDPAQQMNPIARTEFEIVPLLNREEVSVFSVLERVVAGRNEGLRLMAQTSLGEVIQPSQTLGSKEDRDLAYRSINSKRLWQLAADRLRQLPHPGRPPLLAASLLELMRHQRREMAIQQAFGNFINALALSGIPRPRIEREFGKLAGDYAAKYARELGTGAFSEKITQAAERLNFLLPQSETG